jgi:tRNA threonylcarbamoyladenosine biosynthesis protein TsaE
MNGQPEKFTTVHVPTDSEAQTMSLAAVLVGRLHAGDVLALDGELGSGKTCFVRGLAQGLGIDASEVSSPTFVIRHEYSGGAGPALVHIDAYRLTGPSELESIGWSELIGDRSAIVAIEWASRIAPALPGDAIHVAFEYQGEATRLITLSAPAARADSIRGLDRVAVSSTQERACPICGQPVAESSDTLPFCSARCRMADLGRWFKESYRTSRAAEADDELTE